MSNSAQKRVLVFLHYFGGCGQSWKSVIDILQKNYNCIAFDLPGFGGSKPLEKPSIKNLSNYISDEISKLNLDKYILVGHSMGAKFAMQMAADDNHSKIQQLILIAPSPPGIEPIDEKEKKRMLNHPNRIEAEKTVENIVKLQLKPEDFEMCVNANLNTDETTWKWWLNSGMNYSITDQVNNLQIPISILSSSDDPVITPEIISERVTNIFGTAIHLKTSGSGHLLPIEKPESVAEQIINCANNNA